ncbi:MAG: hypothetical protein JW855_04295 [Gammaproteobacteria bacterium]|nr:hypothetical protein [Gammaproteobacteria bacterium]
MSSKNAARFERKALSAVKRHWMTEPSAPPTPTKERREKWRGWVFSA